MGRPEGRGPVEAGVADSETPRSASGYGEAWQLLQTLLTVPKLQSNVQLHGALLRQAMRCLRAVDSPEAALRLQALEAQREQWELQNAQAAAEARETLAQELRLIQPWMQTLLSAED